MRFEYKPLPAVWPFGERTSPRVASKFRAPYNATLKLLERELWYLEAYDLVLEAGYTRGDIRGDGQPRANAKLADPAIILCFGSKHGPLRYGCDQYHVHEDNLRAIALTLEHLRACDRYGVTKRGEQYKGWAALPPSGNGEMSREEAEAFIRHHGMPHRDEEDYVREITKIPLSRFYRRAAKRLHPDIGGDPAEWAKLDRARQAVGL